MTDDFPFGGSHSVSKANPPISDLDLPIVVLEKENINNERIKKSIFIQQYACMTKHLTDKLYSNMDSFGKLNWRTAPHVQVVVVGDDGIGKTSLCHALKHGRGVGADQPPVFDNTTICIRHGRSSHAFVTLWDSSGQTPYDHLRTMSYHKADVILLCFSVDDSNSLTNLKTLWGPEVQRYASQAVVRTSNTF